ncbi:MAG: hypothetical protein GXO82_07085 [Chlorobi bacterium]|nr:hypothetical protein [Chlorobiota bacterium]
MRRLTVFLVTLILAGCSAAGPSVKTTYDSKSNTTRIAVWPPVDIKTDEVISGLSLGAEYTCAGNQTCKPGEIMLSFRTEKPAGWANLLNKLVQLRVDGYQYQFEDARYQGTRTGREILWVSVTPEVFREIADAKTVEGKIGFKEFSIPFDWRKPLREMVTVMEGTQLRK